MNRTEAQILAVIFGQYGAQARHLAGRSSIWFVRWQRSDGSVVIIDDEGMSIYVNDEAAMKYEYGDVDADAEGYPFEYQGFAV